MAVKTDGTLWACGNNWFGQLGRGNTESKRSVRQVGTDANWVSVAAGACHTFALKCEGSLWTWGSNMSGELGDGTAWKDTPVRVPF